MTYWVICILWVNIETNFLWFLVDYVPLFLELKLAFFVWLTHPEYKGAAYLWFAHIKPLHKKFDDEHYVKIIGALEKAALPEAAKANTHVETNNKEEVIADVLNNSKNSSK